MIPDRQFCSPPEVAFCLENLVYLRCLFEVGEDLSQPVSKRPEASGLGLCFPPLACQWPVYSGSAGSLVHAQP